MRDRFDIAVLLALAALALLGLGRAVLLRCQGVNVIAIDSQRSTRELLLDLALLLFMLAWGCETLAHALALRFHLLPTCESLSLLPPHPVRWVGVIVMFLGVILYASALHAMGQSWRLGVDRRRPAPLVTTGVFARSRNPIYLAFDLLILGTLLVYASPSLLLVLLVVPLLLHLQIRREEKFLSQQHPKAFSEYCLRVRRYFQAHP